MRKQTPEQKEIVGRVMHEFKQGELDQRGGEPVKDPRQAIAIALREAGSSNQDTPANNRRNLNRTRRGEARGNPAEVRGETRETLYAEARNRGIRGRSTMSKAELERALH